MALRDVRTATVSAAAAANWLANRAANALMQEKPVTIATRWKSPEFSTSRGAWLKPPAASAQAVVKATPVVAE